MQISKSFHTFSFLWTEALPKGKLQGFVTCCDPAVLSWLLSYCSHLKWISLGKLCLQMELCYFSKVIDRVFVGQADGCGINGTKGTVLAPKTLV